MKIDQVAKVLVGSQHKSHLIVGPRPAPPIIPHSLITRSGAGFKTVILHISNEFFSSLAGVIYVPVTEITFHWHILQYIGLAKVKRSNDHRFPSKKVPAGKWSLHIVPLDL